MMRRMMVIWLLAPTVAFGAALEKFGTSAYPAEPVPAAPTATFAKIKEEAQAAVQKFKTLGAEDKKRVRTQLELKSKEAEQAGNQEAWLYYRMVLDGVGGEK